MEVKREDIEKGMFENISKSLDITTKPEKIWQKKKETQNGNEFDIYLRKDGLKISERNGYWSIIFPVAYTFSDYKYRESILRLLQSLNRHLDEVEKKRIEQEKLQKLSDFFELDIKKQRMKKLEKIENEFEEKNNNL